MSTIVIACLPGHLAVLSLLVHRLRLLVTSFALISSIQSLWAQSVTENSGTSGLGKLTELAPSLINPSSRSLSIISCSCPNANAYGIPNNRTLVDTTQRPLPVKLIAEPVKDAMEEVVEENFARVDGGMMSTRAATRSRSDSDVWRSCSDATEISESGYSHIVSER
jgi:hypothetical protein